MHLGDVIKLFILLQQRLLRTEMIFSPICALYSLFLLSHRFAWRHRIDLVNYFLSRIHFIDDRKEACYLCLVPGHDFEIEDEVVSLSRGKQSQLEDIVAITHLMHF